MNKLEELPLKPKNKHQPYRVAMTTQNRHTCRQRRGRHVPPRLSGAQSTENRKPAVFRQVQHVPQGLCRLPVVHGRRELRSGPPVVVGSGLLTGPPFQLSPQVPVGVLGGHELLLLEHELVGPLQRVEVVDARSRRGGKVRHRGEVVQEDRLRALHVRVER